MKDHLDCNENDHGANKKEEQKKHLFPMKFLSLLFL